MDGLIGRKNGRFSVRFLRGAGLIRRPRRGAARRSHESERNTTRSVVEVRASGAGGAFSCGASGWPRRLPVRAERLVLRQAEGGRMRLPQAAARTTEGQSRSLLRV